MNCLDYKYIPEFTKSFLINSAAKKILARLAVLYLNNDWCSSVQFEALIGNLATTKAHLHKFFCYFVLQLCIPNIYVFIFNLSTYKYFPVISIVYILRSLIVQFV